jgi:hypothetical protein
MKKQIAENKKQLMIKWDDIRSTLDAAQASIQSEHSTCPM